MKIFFAVLYCVLFLCQCTAAPVSLHDSNGRALPDPKGKWVILNYWASWCPGCRRELPELNAFYRKNQDKTLLMYGVNFDRLPMDQLKPAMAKMHFAFPVIVEDPARFWSLNVGGVLPVTFIIGPDGRVRATLSGPQTAAMLRTALQKIGQRASP